jgi:hypothetical protein
MRLLVIGLYALFLLQSCAQTKNPSSYHSVFVEAPVKHERLYQVDAKALIIQLNESLSTMSAEGHTILFMIPVTGGVPISNGGGSYTQGVIIVSGGISGPRK